MKAKIVFFALYSFWSLALLAAPNPAYVSYVERYHAIAIAEMEAYGIPASITLAQGLLESAAGRSYLAVEGNNHFGIKCHRDWSGNRLYRDDDAKNECFRAYPKVEDSYRDHSEFLKYRSRYAFLFELDPTDYKGWAKGLKKAGYATDRRYPERLIKLIEEYNLHQYDLMEALPSEAEVLASSAPKKKVEAEDPWSVILVSDNYVKYVELPVKATVQQISEKLDISPERLLRYNDLDSLVEIEAGKRIYIQPKRRKATIEHKKYVVEKGDTPYEISQKFGIKLKYLYKRNPNIAGRDSLLEGEVLELR